MVEALTAALEAKDTYTKGHSSWVSAYACRIAQEMKLPAKRTVERCVAPCSTTWARSASPTPSCKSPAPSPLKSVR